MAVFGIRAWWQRLRTQGAEPENAAPLDDNAVKVEAMKQPEWLQALIELESARVSNEIRLLSARLLLGTACASALLLCIAVATRVAPSIPFGAATPLTTTIAGASGAALLTALGAVVGRALRRRSGGSETSGVSDGARLGAEPSQGPGSGPGAAP
ncbi:hypothetical protein C3489_32830 [Streptomyces sp. Ru71]|uniref:hypothetical protein n=1 Tax=Streptomyces sp. Ru71 TaxID=2080746 RepID=UPI000CDDCAB2|nr:hypothetical protein [Streptomyces sp. Ru71]POX46045.1 hypothetical protein C3489_32830 [Streptomyces sp. Ru71]